MIIEELNRIVAALPAITDTTGAVWWREKNTIYVHLKGRRLPLRGIKCRSKEKTWNMLVDFYQKQINRPCHESEE